MKTKIILLLGQDDLFSSFVNLLLSEQIGWEVIHVSIEKDLEDIYQIAGNIEPDVVVVQGENCSSDLKALALLFHGNPALKVISIDMKSNLLEIYSKQNVQVQSAVDLITAIEAQPYR